MKIYPRFFNVLFVSTLLVVSLLSSAMVPAGYYHFAKNKSKSELKTALKNVSTPMRVLEYGSGPGFTWEGFFLTDRRSDSTVVDMYSTIVRKQTSFSAVNGMHIEHSLPKSWWGTHENMAYKDLFHLYPADEVTNMTKSNLPLGEVTGVPTLDNGLTKIGKNGFGTSYTDNCFEPADEFKGDFARSYFYISTIYQELAPLWQSPMMNNNSYPVWKPWAIDLLLKWHRQDPVSTKELTRNETIYKIQNNRNPFIDYPALAEYIWSADTTKIYPFPVETQAYLISPKRGTNIDFGFIMTNDTRTQILHIEGINIVGNATLSVKNNTAAIQLTNNILSANEILTGVDVNVVYSPLTASSIRDTLIISGGGLIENISIPIKASASPDFVLLEPSHINPIGGMLQWISDPTATDYRIKVFQPASKAGDLIISTYVEGSSYNKAIEIYNGTGKTVDLSKYALRKQSNGDGAFGVVLPLSGQLQNNKTYTIVNRTATNSTLLQRANLLNDSIIQVNGNDAICLTRSGMIIDMVGEANAGANVIWGLDVTLQRKNTVTHPFSIYNKNEWNVLPNDSVAFIGTHAMAFQTSAPVYLKNDLVGKVTEYEITNLQPNTEYTYSVEALKSSGNIEALNTMQLHTSTLAAPIVMKPDEITSTSFKANWEEELFADGYLIDVFTTEGSADKTETEGFDAVGAGGTPLPNGWSGNSITTYTSATSSGVAAPSIQLNTSGSWLMTKNYGSPVTKFTFMYKFASTGTGSSLLLEGFQNGQWNHIANYPYVNTSRNNPLFNFTSEQNFQQFRFSYNKSSGNMSIDDVQATYGKQDTVFVMKNAAVTANYFLVTALEPNTIYKYRVQSKNGNSTSNYSETVEQKTLMSASVTKLNTNEPIVLVSSNYLTIKNVVENASISVFNLSGACVYSKSTLLQTETTIPIFTKGIYIVKIQSTKELFTKKIILF
ncbi:MAG: endonuclease [Paludibacter sp.]